MDLCAKLSDRVLALENTNTFQAAGIATLKEIVKKLEKKRRSRTYKPKRLYKVGLSRRIESFDEASLGAQEDASKEGRKIVVIDVDAAVTLMDETQGMNDDNLMFDTGVLDEHEVEVEKVVGIAEVVTTASVEIPDELTLARTLIEIKSAKPKVVTTTATTKEQEQLSIEEKSRLFLELMDKRKKHFAKLRVEERRRKPPTKAQKRNTMSTYLKSMAGYKHNQLKTKSFEDIHMLFDQKMKRVNIFVDMNTELVKDEHVEAEIDDDQEEAEMKKHMEIVQDDEVVIDAIPLATKPPIECLIQLYKEGRIGYFQLIRADESLKRSTRNEVCGYILLVKIDLLIKKLEDPEDEHQV
ncbi:hypothetical protein Tco_0383520 [Tanacetum coccineum]